MKPCRQPTVFLTTSEDYYYCKRSTWQIERGYATGHESLLKEARMPKNSYTFEKVDAHISRHLANVKRPSAAKVAAMDLPDICPYYKLIRPILVLLSDFPLIPLKWRTALKIFIEVMDRICPGAKG
jgi:hypothetical protein